MKKETYVKMTKPFRDNARLAQSLHIMNQAITYFIFMLYPALIGYYIYTYDMRIERAIIVPLDCFIIVTVFRYIINRKRPYEKFEVAPIIPKDTKGKSFPSRHVFSAFMVAMTFLCHSPFVWVGIIMIVLSVIIAVIRVLSGVHYISDVIAGAICGIIAGIFGYIIF